MFFLVVVLHIATSVTAIASVYATLLSLNLIQTNNQLLESMANEPDFGLMPSSRKVKEG